MNDEAPKQNIDWRQIHEELLDHIYSERHQDLYMNKFRPADEDRPRPDERVYVVANSWREFRYWAIRNGYDGRGAVYVDHRDKLMGLRPDRCLIVIADPSRMDASQEDNYLRIMNTAKDNRMVIIYRGTDD